MYFLKIDRDGVLPSTPRSPEYSLQVFEVKVKIFFSSTCAVGRQEPSPPLLSRFIYLNSANVASSF